MAEFLDFNLNQAYAELKQRGEAQAVTAKEAWGSLVDDYILEKVDIGELDSDQDLEQIKLALKARWSDYQENMLIT